MVIVVNFVDFYTKYDHDCSHFGLKNNSHLNSPSRL